MSLFEKIKSDRIQAMKNKNTVEKNVLSYIIGQLTNIEKQGDVITDTVVIKELKKLVQSNISTESDELIGENVYLERYIPKVLSETELVNLVNPKLDLIDKSKLQFNLIGVILKELDKEYPGQINGKIASKVIRLGIVQRRDD
jgi:uncharacterized protein YqeY